MYVGHYAASLALKKYDKKLSLGWLFIGVQLVDILFFPLVLMGIERMNIIENYTATNHFQLEYMPFTHSLLATFVWAGLGFVVAKQIWKDGKAVSWIIAAAIASHWFVDLLVHTPDLPLWADTSPKLGFGLWNNRDLAFGLEAIFLFIGLYIYLNAINPASNFKKWGMVIFVIVMIAIQASQVYLPPSILDKTTIAISGVASYLVFAGIAHWIDSK